MKSFKKSLLASACLLAVCCVIGGVSHGGAAPMAAADDVTALIRTSYELGDTISIPKATMDYNGQTIESDSHIVYFPDGSASKADLLTVNDYGTYVIRYMAEVNGKKVYSDKEFSVQQGICSYTNKNSSYYYGKNEDYNTKNGLNLTIKQNDEMRINKVVDLSGLSLSNPFIDLRFTPERYGTADAYTVYMKMTDVYDEDNFVIIRMQNWSDQGSWADGQCYIDARANGQEWTSSVEKAHNRHKRGENGKGWHMSVTSMTGRDSNGNPISNSLKIAYDDAAKQFDTNAKYYGGCLVDLDDPYWYDLSTETLWDGFTTGECYVSFYGDKYNSSAINLHITRLGNNVLNTSDEDEFAPEITVDCDDSALPYAIVGESYKIFDASARDIVDGEVAVIANVYYDYAGSKSLVDSKNGAFVPQKAGVYTIVYRALDKMGNAAYSTVDVECLATANEIDILVEGLVENAKTGDNIQLFDSISLSGLNGEGSYSVVLSKDGKDVEIDAANPFYMPMESGEYTLIITAKDYVLTKQYAHTFMVTENDSAMFINEPLLPKYFIKGAKYSIEDLRAVVWDNGVMGNVTADVYVSENNNDRIKIENGTYQPVEEGLAQIIYEANNNGRVTSKTYDIPVVDVGYTSKLDVGKYFYDGAGKVSSAVTDDYLELTTMQDADIDFINAIQVQNLEMRMNVNKDYQGYQRFYVLLTDVENPIVQVKVTYEKQPDGIFFYLNDNFNIAKRLNARFDESTADNIICNYDNTEKRVFGASEVSYEISKCLNGEPFNGFSGKAYLQIGFEGVNAEARLKVYSINKQALWKFTKDTVAPQIITTTAIGQVAQGTIVRITPAIYMDVLDPNITSQFSVTDNNGDYVRALDGTLLKEGECDPTKTYEIKADVYGDYSIVYTCRDTKASRAGSVLMSFSVADLVAPEVSIVSAVQSAKVGDTVRVASLSVNDNYSQNCTIYYAYSDPNGRVHALGIAKDGLPSFTAKEKGTYIVHCYVFDEANNSTFISYEVIIG